MRKNSQMEKLFGLMAILCIGFESNAQFQVKDLSFSTGMWYGQLTYLDYTSGKPYSMAANLKVSLTEDQLGYIRRFEYPKEPQANRSDTVFVDNHHFDGAKIIQFTKGSSSELSWVTEKMGEDGNDHQKAIIRLSYLMSSTLFRIVKEVQFIGTATWIKRHEYVFDK